MSNLTFKALREANIARAAEPVEAYNECDDWTLADWMTATVGELGELANLLEKVKRGDFTMEEVQDKIAKEFADVQTYLDIMANEAGVDLGDATVKKFNEVSKRVGSGAFITPDGGVVLPVEPYSVGVIVRYGEEPTALFRITSVRLNHGGPGAHRYYGDHVLGGARTGRYHSQCSIATSTADVAMWAAKHPDDKVVGE